MADLAKTLRMACHYGKSIADPGYDPRFDLNGDGKIDFADFIAFASLYR